MASKWFWKMPNTTRGDAPQRVAIVGLGAGTMAAYAGPQRTMTFFEIDPDVESIARHYFTYLDSCGADCKVVIGDGRLELQRVPDAYFDVLMLDAFSSDAIPVHLTSREALTLYLSKLKPNGLIVFHVFNRYLDVARLISGLICDGGLAGVVRQDFGNL